jgi:hypothetical protein
VHGRNAPRCGPSHGHATALFRCFYSRRRLVQFPIRSISPSSSSSSRVIRNRSGDRTKHRAVAVALLEAIRRHADDCLLKFLHGTWPEGSVLKGLGDGDCCTALHGAV